MKNQTALFAWPLLLAGVFAFSTAADAQSQYYWDASNPIKASPGSGGSGNWSTNTSDWWVGGSADSDWTNGNIANFAGTAGTATVSGAVTADGLTFTTAGYVVAGSSTLTLAGTPTITLPGSGYSTITAPVAGTVPVTVTGSGTLLLTHANTSLTGGFTINPGSQVVLSNISGAGTGTITDGGAMTVFTGATSFTAPITGSGTLNIYLNYSTSSDNYRYTGSALAGFNGTANVIPILSGGQTGSAGTGQLIITNTVSAAMTWNVEAGATLDLVSTPGVTFPANVIVAGGGNSQPYGALRLDSVNLTGNVLLNSSAPAIGDDAAGGAAPSQISGVISDNNQGYGFTKIAARSIILAGENTYTGPTILSAGTLQLGSAENVGSSGPLGNSPASNPGNIVLGGGLLQYSAANDNDYSGRFSTAPSQAYNLDENGEVVVFATPLTSSGGSLSLADTAGGGSLTLSGVNTYSGTTTISTGDLIVAGSIASSVVSVTTALGTLQLNTNNALPISTVLTLASGLYFPVDLNFTGTQNITSLIIGGTTMPPGTYGSPDNNNVMYPNSSFTGTGVINVQPPTYWDANGSDALHQSGAYGGGSGNWDTNTANWWQTGATDGKWMTNNVATFAGTAGTVTLDGNVVADGLTFLTSGYDITNTDGISTLTLAGTPIVTIPSGSAEVDCIVAGTSGLTEAGSGTLLLTGSNTFTGAVNIGSGSALVISGTNAFSGATVIGGGGSLAVNGSGALAGGSYPGAITNGGTVSFNTQVSHTLSGIISGGGSLTEDGPGNLTLTGLNTYTGSTTITNGTLAIRGSGDLGNNPAFNTGLYAGSINDNGTFIYNSSAAQTISGIISGNGAVNQSGPAELTLTANNSYVGSTTIGGGTLALSGSGAINSSGSLVIAAGATFDVSALTGPYTLSGSTSLSATGLATIKGPSAGGISFGAQPISLTFTPQSFSGDTTHQALTVSQGALTLNGNVITVINAGAAPLGAGTYTLIKDSSGAITNSPGAVLATVGGAGLAANTTASLSFTNGSFNLVVASTVTPVPVINSFSFSGGNLILTGTNGTAGATYYVLTSTNIGLPLAQWTRIATNTFSGTGAFSSTNAVSVSPSFFTIEAQ